MFIAASCAPPTVSASSPFHGEATYGLDHRWEGNLLACSAGGGPVTTSLRSPLDTENPYHVDVFLGWGTDAGSLITSGSIAQYSDVVVTPSLPPGSWFHVRMSKLSGDTSVFHHTVTW